MQPLVQPSRFGPVLSEADSLDGPTGDAVLAVAAEVNDQADQKKGSQALPARWAARTGPPGMRPCAFHCGSVQVLPPAWLASAEAACHRQRLFIKPSRT